MAEVILEGDCREVLGTLPACSVQTCVTSPPYFGLRDYGHGGQIGLEPTPDEFVAALVEVFREVRRVLRDDGTVWLNLGDSYAGSWGAQSRPPGDASTLSRNGGMGPNPKMLSAGQIAAHPRGQTRTGAIPTGADYKAKDLLGIPWIVAFALRADGWYLRSDIIWSKPNPMPESVTDRPTKAHEYLFLLSKGPRYFYDADAIREPHAEVSLARAGRNRFGGKYEGSDPAEHGAIKRGNGYGPDGDPSIVCSPGGRNKRSVWTVATQPYSGAHFATFPPKLIEPCILAGTSPKACGECGAPWRRLIERSGWPDPENIEDDQGRMKANGDIATDTQRRKELSGARHRAFKVENPDKFLGWEPSCAHRDDTGRSVVLDPFAGSGTTGVVAGQLQREFIGIELNPGYAAMARERILVEGKPGQRNHEPTRVHEDQLGMVL